EPGLAAADGRDEAGQEGGLAHHGAGVNHADLPEREYLVEDVNGRFFGHQPLHVLPSHQAVGVDVRFVQGGAALQQHAGQADVVTLLDHINGLRDGVFENVFFYEVDHLVVEVRCVRDVESPRQVPARV